MSIGEGDQDMEAPDDEHHNRGKRYQTGALVHRHSPCTTPNSSSSRGSSYHVLVTSAFHLALPSAHQYGLPVLLASCDIECKMFLLFDLHSSLLTEKVSSPKPVPRVEKEPRRDLSESTPVGCSARVRSLSILRDLQLGGWGDCIL